VTLAIGDGGNDITMIQQADVGVGIAGSETDAAGKAADFKIQEFRELQVIIWALNIAVLLKSNR